MTDRRIQSCIYEGTHNPITDGFRHPVRPRMAPKLGTALEAPQPIPYMQIYYCRACKMEERRFFGLPHLNSEVRRD